MNALANSQREELEKFLQARLRRAASRRSPTPATPARRRDEERSEILADPPDILLTNYVMLELILTRDRRPEADRARRATCGSSCSTSCTPTAAARVPTWRCSSAGCVRPAGRASSHASAPRPRWRRRARYDERQRRGRASRPSSSARGLDRATSSARRCSAPPRRSTSPTRRSASGSTDRVRAGAAAARDLDRVRRTIRCPRGSSPRSGSQQVDGRWDRVRLRARSANHWSGGGAASRARRPTAGRRLGAVEQAIKEHLLAGTQIANPATGFPVFAFRLHQFISAATRCTRRSRRRPPASHPARAAVRARAAADKLLLPLAFCRACGQEYYSVFRDESAHATVLDDEETSDGEVVVPRQLGQRAGETGQTPGFLYIPPDDPSLADEVWPTDATEVMDRLPTDWIDLNADPPRIKRDRRDQVPAEMYVSTRGEIGGHGTKAWWIPAPFRFCLACGIAYAGRVRSDLTKLATLGLGRALFCAHRAVVVVGALAARSDLPDRAKKLLAFSDNRQDASLQAGHFNDFVMVTMLRAALVRGARTGRPGRSRGTTSCPSRCSTRSTCRSRSTRSTPTFDSAARDEVDRTLRDVLVVPHLPRPRARLAGHAAEPRTDRSAQHRLRIARSNSARPTTSGTARTRPWRPRRRRRERRLCRVCSTTCAASLVDRVDVLDGNYQEQMCASLRPAPARAVGARRGPAASCVRRARSGSAPTKPDDYQGLRVPVGSWRASASTSGDPTACRSTASGPRSTRPPRCSPSLRRRLRIAGILEAIGPATPTAIPSYRLTASRWSGQLGDGETQVHDPLRVARPPKDGLGTNRYFRDLYRSLSSDLHHAHCQGAHRAGRGTRIASSVRRTSATARCRSCTARRRWSSASTSASSTSSACATCRRRRRTTRSAPVAPVDRASRRWSSPTAPPAALMTSTSSAGPSRWSPGRSKHPASTWRTRTWSGRTCTRSGCRVSQLSLGSSMRQVLDLDREAEPKPVLQPSIAAALIDSKFHLSALAAARQVLGLGNCAARADGAVVARRVARRRHGRPGSALPRRLPSAGGTSTGRPARSRSTYHAKVVSNTTTCRREAHRTPPAWRGREAHRAARVRHRGQQPARLRAVPLLRRRGLPAGLQLPATAAVGVRPRPSWSRRRRVPAARPVPGGQRVRPTSLIYHEGSRYRITKVDLPVVAPSADEPDNIVTSKAKRCASCGYLHPSAGREPRSVRALRRGARRRRCVTCSACRTSRLGETTASTPTRRSASVRASRSSPVFASRSATTCSPVAGPSSPLPTPTARQRRGAT